MCPHQRQQIRVEGHADDAPSRRQRLHHPGAAVRLAGHRLIQIARDGSFLPAPLSQDRVVLAPGNRADVLVQPARAGHYPLICEAFDRGSIGSMGGMAGGRRGAGTSRPVTLASMVSAGRTLTPAPLPDALPAEVRPTGRATTRRRTAFQMVMRMGGMAFTIEGRTFDPERDDQLIDLGTTEDWIVTNFSPLAHPFHLHVWPFTVLARSDGAPLAGSLQDVVLIPAAGWVRLQLCSTRPRELSSRTFSPPVRDLWPWRLHSPAASVEPVPERGGAMKREQVPLYALALAILVVGLAAVGVPVRTVLFSLAALACLLMMIFMMGRMHGGHGRGHGGLDEPADRLGGRAEHTGDLRRPATAVPLTGDSTGSRDV